MKIEKTNEELVALIQSGTDVQENMALLYQKFEDCISYYARKVSRNDLHNQQDLKQEGYLALDAAVKKYDVDRGGGFITYTQRRIYGAMLDSFYKSGFSMSVPSKTGYQVRRYNTYVISFRHENGRTPTDDEIIAALQITPKSLKTIRQANSQELRLDAFMDDAEDSVITESFADSFDLEESVIEEMNSQKCKKHISSCIARLEEKEEIVIHDIYWNGKTFREIAEVLGCTKSGIQFLKEKALSELRAMDEIQELYDAFDYRSESLKATGFRAWKETSESSVERAVRKKLEQEKKIEHHFEKVVGVSVSEALPHFDQLDEKKRKLLICRYIEYQKVEDILSKMCISDTHYWRLHQKALKALKEILAA